MSEDFDNYGLRVVFNADYKYDNGRKLQYVSEAVEPSVNTLAEMLVELVESCFGWGQSREFVIARIIEALEEIEL